MAYFLEVGLVLTVAPWTAFWEHNLFVGAWPAATGVLLSPWLRGALSGLGVVTVGAGVIDLIGIFLRQHTSPSAQSPH